MDCSRWKNERTMQRAIAEELNLSHVFGIPVFGKGKVLWTKGGRFFRANCGQVKLMPSSYYTSSYSSYSFSMNFYWDQDRISGMKLPHLWHQEAVGVICEAGMDGINPETVLSCFLYPLVLRHRAQSEDSTDVDYGCATHASCTQ